MTMPLQTEKTVYILGAGFSAPAGGPNQAHLLRYIFDLPDTNDMVRKCKRRLKAFLKDALNIAPSALKMVSLEDIYTPIDRCLADGVSLRNKSTAELQTVRGELEYLISLAIDTSFETNFGADRQYIRDFAKHLVKQASERAIRAECTDDARAAKEYDPFSIISLNWDIVLDKALHQQLGEFDRWETRDYAPFGVVDYCCYISSVESGEKRIRSGLWTLGARGYNVKLLKIHGSMNWLQCSNCQRLFVSFDQKILIPNCERVKKCRHCERYGVSANLQGSLVMPTFLKDLTNFQIKLVWQNTAVELMEAQKLVFIGYSLPHADFEFRQLLSRMVHPNAQIHVVLYDGSTKYEEEKVRYEQFFSNHRLTFESKGVVEFVKKLVRPAS